MGGRHICDVDMDAMLGLYHHTSHCVCVCVCEGVVGSRPMSHTRVHMTHPNMFATPNGWAGVQPSTSASHGYMRDLLISGAPVVVCKLLLSVYVSAIAGLHIHFAGFGVIGHGYQA